MNGIVAGILLPASTLSQPWFQTLAAFVACNTLIYVGLTVAKTIRWPQPLRARRRRRERTAALSA